MTHVRSLTTILAVILATLMAATSLIAQDRVEHVDGTVYEGQILREHEGIIWIRASIGGIEQEIMLLPGEVAGVERDAVASSEAAVAAATPKPETRRQSRSGAPRVAIISLGENPDKSQVGLFVTAESLERIIPSLLEDEVQTVVFHVDSPGGYLYEIIRVSDLIEEEFKKHFRVVIWVRSAISAAAMISHTVEEIYFMSHGRYGASTGLYGDLQAIKDRELEDVLALMERISRRGGHHPAIMRSMQIDEPLSATIDEHGDVHWSNSEDGDHIVNPKGQVLTLTADNAVRFGFARGIADDHHTLARLMGYNEVEWVGREVRDIPYPVSRAEEELRRFRDRTYRDLRQTRQYLITFNQALQMAAGRPPEERGPFLGRATQSLRQIEDMVRNNGNFAYFVLGIPPAQFRDWVDEQRERIAQLRR